jgi:diguanylate cyclase (GGDEF)-like protein
MAATDYHRAASAPTLVTAAAFNAAAVAAATAESPGAYLNDALGQLADLLAVPACAVFLHEESGARCAAAFGLDGADLAAHRPDRLPAGFVHSWTVPLELVDGRPIGDFVAYVDSVEPPDADTLELAYAYGSVLALGLDRVRQQSLLAARYHAVVLALTSALDARDEYAGGHSTETSELAERVARRLSAAPAELELIAQVAVLHDVGKLGVPTEVLVKDGPLDAAEWALIRQHPVIGERMLGAIPGLRAVATAVRHEHERWDGHGYPDGLAGEQIPLASRIVFACDAWHAMTSDRPYRPAIPRDRALEQLRDSAGGQFDPRVAQALLEVLGEQAPPPACSPSEAREEALSRELSELAAQLGADDLLVFRRVSGGVYSHLGGVGRGAGWAGNIELDSREERHVRAALAEGRPVSVALGRSRRIVGPYYARSAVIVSLGEETVVVFGSPAGAVADLPDRAAQLAERARALVEDVSPAKRLADELEVLAAVRQVTTVNAESMSETLVAIAGCARQALSAEFAAACLMGSGGQSPVIGVSAGRWEPLDPNAAGRAVARFAEAGGDLPFLSQDVSLLDDPPAGFGHADGVSSMHVLPIGSPTVAMLLVVHAEPGLRGFTDLCQRVATAISEAAEPVVRRAIAQDELRAENARLAERVRTDALTGVASRSAWDDALRAHAHADAAERASLSVVIVDVDGLKRVNDAGGHRAGDELLRRCARALAAAAGPDDLVARIGGDEFGVLLKGADDELARVWCARVNRLLRESEDPDLQWSLGFASVPPHETIAAAVDEADRRMYAYKTRSRAPGIR